MQVNHMRVVMDKIIMKMQNAFERGRQIFDLVLITNEYLESRIRLGNSGILVKLHMEKACDHVNWEFLIHLRGLYAFGEKWCMWIKRCISMARFSILVNGNDLDFFNSTRGLKQGDPLSPSLFILVMSALSRMIEAIVKKKVSY